jgi:hypothetical protein
MPRRPDAAALERLARHLYHVGAMHMLRERGQKMTPHREFDHLPHDERGMWRSIAEDVAAGRHNHTLMD